MLAAVGLVAVLAVAGQSRAEAIINGDRIDSVPATHPILYIESDGQVGCTATLIAPQVVLTAGHCVQLGSSVAVVVGDAFVDSRSNVAAHAVAIARASDGTPGVNDLALVLLDRVVLAEVMPLAETNESWPYAPRPVQLAGFGLNERQGLWSSARSLVTATSQFNTRFVVDSPDWFWLNSICLDQPDAIGMYCLQGVWTEMNDGANPARLVSLVPMICFGDSGGPAIDLAGRQFAVASAVSINPVLEAFAGPQPQQCHHNWSLYAPLNRPWIDATLAGWGVDLACFPQWQDAVRGCN